jgi:C-terminal processing protease CtpA/Prc
MNTHASASEQGRALYHAIWATVGAHFYDRSKLADWASWEHRFDAQIDGDEAAIRLAAEAIASLNDQYTKLRVKPQSIAEAQPSASPEAASEEPANVLAVVTKDNIGYLRVLSFFKPGFVRDMQAALQQMTDCDGVVLDLRYNPGGLMAETLDCCELFLRTGVLATVETRAGNGVVTRKTELLPEVCLWIDSDIDGNQHTEVYKRLPTLVAGKPLVILVSPITASSAELLVCALVLNGAVGLVTTVGRTTLGKGIGQSEWIDVLGKVELRISTCRWLTATGDWLGDGSTDGNGIEPEHLVPDDRGPEGLEVAFQQVRSMVAALRQEAAG